MTRAVQLLVALACAALGAFLALHHPLSGLAATALFALLCVAGFAHAHMALLAVFVALPVVGLMPWTGWVMVEELDIALLAVAAGGYLSAALQRTLGAGGRKGLPPQRGESLRAMPLKVLLVVCMAIALGVSTWRGVLDAGGLSVSWWQGLHEPLNSFRLAKSFALALLLLPLWLRFSQRNTETAQAGMQTALATSLALVALLTMWERHAFVHLLNFSSDYRTTALFWEMNVGGAALDGFLALTMPFAVARLMRQGSAISGALAVGGVLLGAYACLTTFSRTVYLAVPIGVAVLLVLSARQRAGAAPRAGVTGELGVAARYAIGAALVLMFGIAAAVVFPTGGHRTVLALLGVMALLLPLAGYWQGQGWQERGLALAAGSALSLPLSFLAFSLPKGAYLVYSVCWLATAVLVLAQLGQWMRMPAKRFALLTQGLFIALLACTATIGPFWGGAAAQGPNWMACALLALAALYGASGTAPRWPTVLRWQGSVLGVMASTAVAVGVALGGAYMGDRFSTSSNDLQSRQEHWARALALLDNPLALAFGKGVGRYPTHHILSGNTGAQAGDYRLRGEAGKQHLALSAGMHMQGWGEMFRMSQRIDGFGDKVVLRLDVRADKAAVLHADICPKHLLYDNSDCIGGPKHIAAKPGVWQAIEWPLQEQRQGLSHGHFPAYRFLAFSMAVETSGALLEVDKLSLTDVSGQELLRNGDFEAGLKHWYFTSDKHHLPWHMKNMALHLLFEQGWVGLMLVATALMGALWHVSLGSGRRNPLAPALAAALVGFCVIGLFDSLLDVPRVAFLFYWLLLIGLFLPSTAGNAVRAPSTRPG